MVPRIVAAVKFPVLASGGMPPGPGCLRRSPWGPRGSNGHPFVATAEARAHDAYKQALASATPGDTMIIKRTLGMPGRVLA